jgi:thiol-disulfide isomerase/thioredoxin
MKQLFLVGALLLLGSSGCGSRAASGSGPSRLEPLSPLDLSDRGPAPELTNTVWLNTDHPLRLADLRGKVVALEMWTFDCINCQHTIPALTGWYDKYTDQGLVIIGDHFPEYSDEADLGHLKAALVRLGVPYAVAQDNNGTTWQAYRSTAWPSLYLIDKRGHLRYIQIGEGGYAAEELAIQTLLAEPYP